MHKFTTQQTVHMTLRVLLVLLLLGLAPLALAANLSLSPATGVYSTGQTFTARVVVNTSGAAINAADGTVKFNPNELSVVSVSKGSVFNLWTAEPAFSNTAGTVTFSGGTPTGYTGGAGTVLNITFRAKGSGPAKVNFTSGSVLAADGLGTNVLSGMSGGTYTISAVTETPEPEVIIEYVPPANTPGKPQVNSSTHPDSNKWYKTSTAELSWTVPAGVTSVRTLLDNSASSIPTKVYDTPISSITLDELEDGVQYFHIQFRNADGWGSVTHYRLAVDTESPSDLVLSLPENADLSSPTQSINVAVNEEVSSVTTYKIQINGGEPFDFTDETGSSTIILSDLEPGYHTVMVEAFDEAGNSTVGTLSFSVLAFDKPAFTEYPSEINEEVIPVIKGVTRPNAEVVVTVSKLGLGASTAEAATEYTVMSGSDGVFTIIPEGTFSLGVYELTAVATDQYGAKSEPSDSVRIAVQKPGYLQFGSLALSVLSVFVPILALLGLSVLGVWFLIIRIRRMRSSVARESKEALAILATEFKSLEQEIVDHRETLAASRKTKKLTKAETMVLEAITESLNASRQRVEKEIEDVEDIVE